MVFVQAGIDSYQPSQSDAAVESIDIKKARKSTRRDGLGRLDIKACGRARFQFQSQFYYYLTHSFLPRQSFPSLFAHKDEDAAPPAARTAGAPPDSHAFVDERGFNKADIGRVDEVELWIVLGRIGLDLVGSIVYRCMVGLKNKQQRPIPHRPYNPRHPLPCSITSSSHKTSTYRTLGLGSCSVTSMPKRVRGSKRADLKIRLWRVGDRGAEEAST